MAILGSTVLFRSRRGWSVIKVVVFVSLCHFIVCIVLISDYIAKTFPGSSSYYSNSADGTMNSSHFLKNWTNLIYPLKVIPAFKFIKGHTYMGMLSRKCKVFERPKEDFKPPTQQFQDVVKGKSFVFSAFYDNRQRPLMIVAVGIARAVDADGHPLFCRMWYKDQPEPDIQHINITVLPEVHDAM